jgi:hypothetical protein
MSSWAIMTVRTQITLDAAVRKRARAKAAELGISLTEYVRRLIVSDLGAFRPRADISLVFDLGSSSAATDIARYKDKMAGDAAWREYVDGCSGKQAAKRRRD